MDLSYAFCKVSAYGAEILGIITTAEAVRHNDWWIMPCTIGAYVIGREYNKFTERTKRGTLSQLEKFILSHN